MANIGKLSQTRDGGWSGSVFVFAMDLKINLTPNDDRLAPKAPAFRILSGGFDIGAAWQGTTQDKVPRSYLRGEIDFPGLPAPLSVAIFFTENTSKAKVVWNRRHSQDTVALET